MHSTTIPSAPDPICRLSSCFCGPAILICGVSGPAILKSCVSGPAILQDSTSEGDEQPEDPQHPEWLLEPGFHGFMRPKPARSAPAPLGGDVTWLLAPGFNSAPSRRTPPPAVPSAGEQKFLTNSFLTVFLVLPKLLRVSSLLSSIVS